MNVASAMSFVWDTKPDFPSKVVVFHPLVRFGEAGDQFDHDVTGLKLKACLRLYMAFI